MHRNQQNTTPQPATRRLFPSHFEGEVKQRVSHRRPLEQRPVLRAHAQHGAALIIVLMLFVILTAITLSFFTMTRTESRTAVNVTNTVRADQLLDSAFARAAAQLNQDLQVHPNASSTDHSWRTYFNGAWVVGKTWAMANSVPLSDVEKGTPEVSLDPLERALNTPIYAAFADGYRELLYRGPRTAQWLYIPRTEELAGAGAHRLVLYDSTVQLEDQAGNPLSLVGVVTTTPAPNPQSYYFTYFGDPNEGETSFVTTGFYGPSPVAPDPTVSQYAAEQVATWADYDLDGDGLEDAVWLPMAASVFWPTISDDNGDGLGDEKADGIDNDLDGDIDEPGEPVTFVYNGLGPYLDAVNGDLARPGDGLDNDGDGAVDEADEDQLFLTAALPGLRVRVDLNADGRIVEPPAGATFTDSDSDGVWDGFDVLVGRVPVYIQIPSSIPVRTAQGTATVTAANVDALDNDYDQIINNYHITVFPGLENRSGLTAIGPVDTNNDGNPDEWRLADGTLIADLLEATAWVPTAPLILVCSGEPVSEIIGRAAVYIADESAKVNLNVAGGHVLNEVTALGEGEGDVLLRSLSDGATPSEYDTRVLPGIGVARSDKLWGLLTGSPDGVLVGNDYSAFDHLNPALVPTGVPYEDDRMARLQGFEYDVSFPGYGRVDDNANALALAMNGVDDDGDGLVDEGLFLPQIDPAILTALANVANPLRIRADAIRAQPDHITNPNVARTVLALAPLLTQTDRDTVVAYVRYQDYFVRLGLFEGIDEPAELQRFSPLRNPLAEVGGVDNSGNSVADEPGELADRQLQNLQQSDDARLNELAATPNAAGLYSKIKDLATVFSTTRNASNARDVYGKLKSFNDLDPNYATAEQLAARLLEANDFAPVTNDTGVFSNTETRQFAIGLRQGNIDLSAPAWTNALGSGGGILFDATGTPTTFAFPIDPELEAMQVAANLRDFRDSDYARSALTTEYVDKVDQLEGGALESTIYDPWPTTDTLSVRERAQFEGSSLFPLEEIQDYLFKTMTIDRKLESPDEWWEQLVGGSSGTAGKGEERHISYTIAGNEAIKINEIMVRPVRRVEAEATPGSGDTFDPQPIAGMPMFNLQAEMLNTAVHRPLSPLVLSATTNWQKTGSVLGEQAGMTTLGSTSLVSIGPDTDKDTLPDLWEIQNGLNPRNDKDATAANINLYNATGRYPVADALQYRIRATDGLPAGQYYLTIKAHGLDATGQPVLLQAGELGYAIKYVPSGSAGDILGDMASLLQDIGTGIAVHQDFEDYYAANWNVVEYIAGAFPGEPEGWAFLDGSPRNLMYPSSPRLPGYYAGTLEEVTRFSLTGASGEYCGQAKVTPAGTLLIEVPGANLAGATLRYIDEITGSDVFVPYGPGPTADQMVVAAIPAPGVDALSLWQAGRLILNVGGSEGLIFSNYCPGAPDALLTHTVMMPPRFSLLVNAATLYGQSYLAAGKIVIEVPGVDFNAVAPTITNLLTGINPIITINPANPAQIVIQDTVEQLPAWYSSKLSLGVTGAPTVVYPTWDLCIAVAPNPDWAISASGFVIDAIDFSQEPDHEYVELTNTSNEPVNIGGWTLEVGIPQAGTERPDPNRTRWTAPAGTVVAPQGMVVLGFDKFDGYRGLLNQENALILPPPGTPLTSMNGMGLATSSELVAGRDIFNVSVPPMADDYSNAALAPWADNTGSVFAREPVAGVLADYLDTDGDSISSASLADAQLAVFGDTDYAKGESGNPWDRVIPLTENLGDSGALGNWAGYGPDTDRDGIPDAWELTHDDGAGNFMDPSDNGSLNINNGPDGDIDGDGNSNWKEYVAEVSPMRTLQNCASVDELARWILRGGALPNYPEQDNVDNDGDGAFFTKKEKDPAGPYEPGTWSEPGVIYVPGTLDKDMVDNNLDGWIDENGLTTNNPLLSEGVDEGRSLSAGEFEFGVLPLQFFNNRDEYTAYMTPAGILANGWNDSGASASSAETAGLVTRLGNATDNTRADFIQRGVLGTTKRHAPYLGSDADPPDWKAFAERRWYPGDNVIVSLYNGDPSMPTTGVVDRASYREFDVTNRTVDDLQPSPYQVDGFHSGVPNGALNEPDDFVNLNPQYPTFWPPDQMGLDFYRSLERKSPFYAGDRFGTSNRWEATDGNYDDWSDSLSVFALTARYMANYQTFPPTAAMRPFEGEEEPEAQRLLGHCVWGSPLRANLPYRMSEDPKDLGKLVLNPSLNSGANRGDRQFWAEDTLANPAYPNPSALTAAQEVLPNRDWTLSEAVVRNNSLANLGELAQLPLPISHHVMYTSSFVATGGAPLLFDATRVNRSLTPDNLVATRQDTTNRGAVLGASTATALFAATTDMLSTESLILTVGQADFTPLAPDPTSLVNADLDITVGIPSTWLPIYLFAFPSEFSANIPYPLNNPSAPATYIPSAIVANDYLFPAVASPISLAFAGGPNTTLNATLLSERWPLEKRTAMYLSRSLSDAPDDTPVAVRPQALLTWDAEDGLENGEYYAYVRAVSPALAGHLVGVNNSLPVALTDFARDLAKQDFSQARLALDFITDRTAVPLPGAPENATWNPGAYVPGEDGVIAFTAQPATATGVLNEGWLATPVRVTNNYLALRVRNMGPVGSIAAVSEVILAPRKRTPGKINVNTAEPRLIAETGTYGTSTATHTLFTPLVGIPGIVDTMATLQPRTANTTEGEDGMLWAQNAPVGIPTAADDPVDPETWTGWSLGMPWPSPDNFWPALPPDPRAASIFYPTDIDPYGNNPLGPLPYAPGRPEDEAAALRLSYLISIGRPEHFDGRYYSSPAELVGVAPVDAKNGVAAPLQATPLSNEGIRQLDPDPNHLTTRYLDPAHWFGEVYERYRRMSNVVTTRSDVFEIKAIVQAGKVTDTNNDGRLNYRDNEEFTASSEARGHMVYERRNP